MLKRKLFVFDSFEAGEDLSEGIDKQTSASIEADVLKLANSPRPSVQIEEMGAVIDWTLAIKALSEVLQKEQLLDLFHQGVHIEAAERGRVPVIKSFPPNQPTLKDLATLAAALIEEDLEDFDEDVCLWCYADYKGKNLGLLLCEFTDNVV
jgi:hypothetical protein